MKHLRIVVISLLCSCLFNQGFAQAKKAPYKALYSSNFKIGNPAYSTIILNLWKDWDENEFDRHDYFADTIKMWLPEGYVVKGKDSAIAGAKRYRGAMTKAVSTIHAFVPLHSNDKGEDVVCVWGTEEDTYPDGRVETRDLHEVWWFNKAGKVSMMRQFSAKFGR